MTEIIRQTRYKIRDILDANASKKISMMSMQNRKIISDALVYLAFKKSCSKEQFNLENNIVINKIKDYKRVNEFLNALRTKTVSIQNVINVAVDKLGLEKHKTDNLNVVLESAELKDKPDIKLALNIYLLKGKFNWVNLDGSKFKDFLMNDKLDTLRDDAYINCWEAVLYSMMKSGLIEKNQLKEYYNGNFAQIQNKLEKLFDFNGSIHISKRQNKRIKWNEVMSLTSQLIMMSNDGKTALDHDMISVPFSQKQILKMLITEKFYEKPTRPKIFSHWLLWTDGNLGTVKKSFFTEKLKNPSDIIKIKPINELNL